MKLDEPLGEIAWDPESRRDRELVLNTSQYLELIYMLLLCELVCETMNEIPEEAREEICRDTFDLITQARRFWEAHRKATSR
jgi:hypothetical protein